MHSAAGRRTGNDGGDGGEEKRVRITRGTAHADGERSHADESVVGAQHGSAQPVGTRDVVLVLIVLVAHMHYVADLQPHLAGAVAGGLQQQCHLCA